MARGRTRKPVRRLRPLRGRWLALAALAFIGFLYLKPLRTYVETREAVARRAAEVEALAARNEALRRKVAEQASQRALVREARRRGYWKAGERLFIVTGIPAWRRERERAARR